MPEEHHVALNPNRTLVYRFAATLLTVLSKILFRPRVIGAQNIPLEGPVLIAPIHRSNVDFAFTLFISPRKVFFMAKDSLFKNALFGSLLGQLGAFPVRRGSADRIDGVRQELGRCCARDARSSSFLRERGKRGSRS